MILNDARKLDPRRFTRGNTYDVVGELANTDCLIVAKDDIDERVAICGWRFKEVLQ